MSKIKREQEEQEGKRGQHRQQQQRRRRRRYAYDHPSSILIIVLLLFTCSGNDFYKNNKDNEYNERLFFSFFSFFCPVVAWELLSPNTSPGSGTPGRKRIVMNRRLFVSGMGGIVTATSLGGDGTSDVAQAAQGAAELDFGFYMKDLMGGNKKEGTIEASKPIAMPPPRTIEQPLLSLLLDDNCSRSCVPVQALIEEIVLLSSSSSSVKGTTKMDDQYITLVERNIGEKMEDYRTKSKPSFFIRAPWKEETVSDQYYFDVTAYALWRTAAEFIPNYLSRDQFARNVGRLLYQRCQTAGLLTSAAAPPPPPGAANDVEEDDRLLLKQPELRLLQILEMFQASNFCKGYRVVTTSSEAAGGDVVVDTSLQTKIFDELDEETLESGGTVDVLISIYEPATLGASLQITGEQSRFIPDFVGPTIAAMFQSQGIKTSWETFFVDPVYRPNPKDYFPNEKLLQFSLSKST